MKKNTHYIHIDDVQVSSTMAKVTARYVASIKDKEEEEK